MKRIITAAAIVTWAIAIAAQTGSVPVKPAAHATPVTTSPDPSARSARMAGVAGQNGSSTQTDSNGEAAAYRTWLNRYCVGCHSNRSASPANDPLNLEAASLTDPLPHAATWERVLRKLNVRAMPPPGAPHPSDAEFANFTGWLSASLDRAWAARSTPGEYVAHRLNRTEYGNVIRDLLALDIDVEDLLPADSANFGFDNIATSLKTSPLLLERYLTAAQRISGLAVGDPDSRPVTTEYPISRQLTQMGRVDGLPLGARGGVLVHHVFPADGEYRLAGRLVRANEEGYVGLEGQDSPHVFVITVDGAEVHAAPLGGRADHDAQAKSVTETQVVIDKRMAARVRVSAGPHEIGFTWKERPAERQDVWQPSRRESQESHMVGGLPRLNRASVEGPYDVTGVSDTPSRARIFVCRPTSPSRSAAPNLTADAACARRIFSTLTRRAYRRPTTAVDIEAPMAFYDGARRSGASFDAGVRAGLARVLSSPSFLFRIEHDPAASRAGSAHAVTDVDLASRLSFFLWSSMPDDRLLTLASSGRLRSAGVLDAEVRRMLADPRADALVGNFTGQWLQLRNLEARVAPDVLMFPDFDDNLRQAFRRETELLFAQILRGNRSTLELLNANYTFVNERLARHYGIPGVYGNRFRQVPVTDPNRFGLLGHGSILSLTSVATRTSPVIRGKYILTTFLNTPPPPPLPNVPTLEESAKGAAVAPKTVRAQLELHRKNPTCASCHRVIDPVGFALENFNPVGQWRDTDADGTPIDAAGVLADGSKVDRPAALRDVVLKHPDAFVATLTERLLVYALGRGLEPSDMPTVRHIVHEASGDEYRLGSIVRGIVDSAPFQMRTTPERPASVDRIARTSRVTSTARVAHTRRNAHTRMDQP